MHNFLLIRTADIKISDIAWGLLENGYECDIYDLNCNVLDENEEEALNLESFLKGNVFHFIFSMDFSPTISYVCEKLGIIYISWIYDSPLKSLYSKQAFNQVNFFFIFDKKLTEWGKKRGIHNIFYLPLAANVTKMGQINISIQDEKKYRCDVSFVGSGYTEEIFGKYYELMEHNYRKELELIINEIIGKWDGEERLSGALSEEIIKEFNRLSNGSVENLLGVPERVYFEENLLAKVVAHRERRMMMEKISYLAPRWYGSGNDKSEYILGVNYFDRLSYEQEIPKAYYLSRINLSTCLHSIGSGVPLRVFDIMGAGGFIITNYQPELEELFEIGKEIVVYHNFDEMKELVEYFLQHEEERMKILISGYRRVSENYSYKVAVKKIFDNVLK